MGVLRGERVIRVMIIVNLFHIVCWVHQRTVGVGVGGGGWGVQGLKGVLGSAKREI